MNFCVYRNDLKWLYLYSTHVCEYNLFAFVCRICVFVADFFLSSILLSLNCFRCDPSAHIHINTNTHCGEHSYVVVTSSLLHFVSFNKPFAWPNEFDGDTSAHINTSDGIFFWGWVIDLKISTLFLSVCLFFFRFVVQMNISILLIRNEKKKLHVYTHTMSYLTTILPPNSIRQFVW